MSCKKELEHHQLEERRTIQTVSQISQDSANIFKEIDNSKQKGNSATAAISNLEKERNKLEEEIHEIEKLIKIQNNRADTISEKLINKPGDIMGLVRPDWVDSDDSEELDCFL